MAAKKAGLQQSSKHTQQTVKQCPHYQLTDESQNSKSATEFNAASLVQSINQTGKMW